MKLSVAAGTSPNLILGRWEQGTAKENWKRAEFSWTVIR